MNDEFNKSVNEYNKDVSEYKKFDAIEYLPLPEVRKDGEEILKYKEDSSDSGKKDLDELRKKIDDINNIEKRDINELNQNNTTELNGIDAPQGALAESTTANVVATSTTLAGGVTVLSAAAVVAGSMAGGIMDKAPDVVSCNIEVGADYLIYEIDLENLTMGADYKIKVYNDSFSIEYPVDTTGINRKLVTGLTPLRTYNISVIGNAGVFEDYVFYTTQCYTSVNELPKALFEFTPILDEQNHVYSLQYDIYFSNYYNIASSPSLEIYSTRDMLIEDFELDENNFFRGVLEDLPDNEEINARVYGAIDGERELISEYGYMTEYPDGFISYDKMFASTYEFDEKSITSSYDIEKGNILDITTNFKLGLDKTEYLRFDIYDSDDNLINTINSTDETLEIILDPIYTNVNIKVTEIKEKNGEAIEYGYKEQSYSFSPLFGDIKLYLSNEMFSLGLLYLASEEELDKEFSIDVIKNYSNNNSITTTETFTGLEYASELSFDDSYTLEDLLSIDIVISYGDIKLYKTNIIKPEITYSDFDVSDSGNVILGYDIKEIEGYTFNNAVFALYDGATIEQEVTSLNGEIEIEELNKNFISGDFSINYKTSDGTQIDYVLELTKDLAAEVEVVGYASMHNSQLYYNLDFITTLNGKEINMTLDIITDKTVDDAADITLEKASIDEAKYDMDGKFYSIRMPDENYSSSITKYQISYIINTEGFSNDENFVTLSKDILTAHDNTNHERYNFTFNNETLYVKAKNSNGLTNYYFNTGFSSENSNIYQRIFYSYIDNGVTKYGYTPYFTSSSYVIENLGDFDYTFDYRVYYYNDYYYENELDIASGYSYTGVKEVSGTNLLISESDMIYQDNSDIAITFTLDNRFLNTGENIIVTYNDLEYEIEIKEAISSDSSDSYSYSYDGDTYSYYVEIMMDNGEFKNFNVILTLNDLTLLTTDVKLSVPFSPNNFITSSGFELDEDLSYVSDIDICKYSGTYNEEETINSISEASLSHGEYNITVYVADFTSSDSRDSYRLEFYNGDEIIDTTNYYATIPAIYDSVSIRLVLYRAANDYEVIFKTVELGEVSLEKKYYVNDVVFENSGESYSFSAELNSEVTFSKIEYTEYYLDGTKASFNSTEATIEKETQMSNISKIEFNIYYTDGTFDILAGKYVYNASDITGFNLGDVSLDDDMNILLSYDTTLTDIQLVEYLDTSVEEINSSGTFIIDNLISNEIEFRIRRMYTDEYGNTVDLTYVIYKVLSIDIDSDYYLSTTYVSNEDYTGDARTFNIKATPKILDKEIDLNELQIVFTECGSDTNPKVSSTKTSYINTYTSFIMYENTLDDTNTKYSVKYHFLLPNGDIYDNNGSDFEYVIESSNIESHSTDIYLTTDLVENLQVTRNSDSTINLTINELRSDSSIDIKDGEYFRVTLSYTEYGETKYIYGESLTGAISFDNVLDTIYQVSVEMLYKDSNGVITSLKSTKFENINSALVASGSYEAQTGSYTAYFYIAQGFVENSTFVINVNGEELSVEYVDANISGTFSTNSGVTYTIELVGSSNYYINFTGLSLGDNVSITVSEGNVEGNYKEMTYSLTAGNE